MTVSLLPPGPGLELGGPADGGMAARRAVVRWSWRMFRREWRQQMLILGLIVVAVAATLLGAAVASNAPQPTSFAFGTARDMAVFPGSDPRLASHVALLEHHFGRVDVIANRTLPIPGSVNTYDVRAQDPDGPYGKPLLSLVSGRYPSGPGQVALTKALASTFGVKIGGTWGQGGQPREVVGIVQNPQSLLDEFALVAPGQLRAPTQVTVLFDAGRAPPISLGRDVTIENVSSAKATNAINPDTLSIAGLTFGMLLIALVCVGGFTVVAQRRLRSLGMLASLGATDRNLGLVVRANGVVVGAVGAVLGAALGFVLWLGYRPHLESSSHHLIGIMALPWTVIALALVISVVATYLAASRPARTISKVPIVLALSGRPAPPKLVRRSAVPGLVFLAISFLLLGYSGSQDSWGHSGGGQGELVLGLAALIPAVILLAPFCLSVMARLGRRTPITVRLALRDLDRYRARSGSALAAISLGVLIAVIITIVAAARYANVLDYVGPNLAANQLIVYTPNGPGYTPPGLAPPVPANQLQAMGKSANAIATSLGAGQALELVSTSATLSHAAGSRNFTGSVYVATPQLLRAFGVKAAALNPQADILTMRPGLSGLGKMQLVYGNFAYPVQAGPGPEAHVEGQPPPANSQGPPANSEGAPTQTQAFPCPRGSCVANPVIQEVRALPAGVSAPNTVITERAVHALGLHPTISGWLIQTRSPLTAAQVNGARTTAAASRMSIETKNDEPTSAEVINWATFFGIALALGILAMSVGLIRSETASDLQTLTAAGASSRARRTITAATAGALALLGAVLGTVAGYVGVAGWLRSNSLAGGLSSLGNVPVTNLLVILLGMPLLAIVLGWLLSGREPPVIGHQPLE